MINKILRICSRNGSKNRGSAAQSGKTIVSIVRSNPEPNQAVGAVFWQVPDNGVPRVLTKIARLALAAGKSDADLLS